MVDKIDLNQEVEKLDPMTMVESVTDSVGLAQDDLNTNGEIMVLARGDASPKRPRGKPKKNTNPRRDPSCLVSSPSKSLVEAEKTWYTAKLLGVSAEAEEAVVRELRKSKRLQLLDEVAS
ncbi:unnamed protein product [Amaranthus hypochondriacus]